MRNKRIIYIHIFIALLAALILYMSVKPLNIVGDDVLITDSVISGIVLSILLFVLQKIIVFSLPPSLPLRQKYINYVALAILFVFIWIGAEYLFLYFIFEYQEYQSFASILTIRIVVALLVYLLAIRQPGHVADIGIEDMQEDLPVSEEIQHENNKSELEILERIAVRKGQKIEVLPVDKVICIQAEGDYVMIYCDKGKFLKEQTMKSLEGSLPQDKFVRIHRSSIINVDHIAQIELYNKQSQMLRLKDGMQVKMSMSGYKSLKDKLGL